MIHGFRTRISDLGGEEMQSQGQGESGAVELVLWLKAAVFLLFKRFKLFFGGVCGCAKHPNGKPGIFNM